MLELVEAQRLAAEKEAEKVREEQQRKLEEQKAAAALRLQAEMNRMKEPIVELSKEYESRQDKEEKSGYGYHPSGTKDSEEINTETLFDVIKSLSVDEITQTKAFIEAIMGLDSAEEERTLSPQKPSPHSAWSPPIETITPPSKRIN